MPQLPSIELTQIRIPGYEVLRPLGQGGMATVFLARQVSLDRMVAIKVLSRDFRDDTDMIRRFQLEAETLARLDHPNIVSVVDRGLIQRHHYFVMEYVEGATLKDVLAEGRLTVEELLAVIESVGKALAVAHDNGVVHRDVKPSNVLLSKDGTIKLSDFGIAAILRYASDAPVAGGKDAGRVHQDMADNESQMTIGTAMYMAPEQAIDASKATGRSDIFSFAILIQEALTGESPSWDAVVPSRVTKLATKATDKVLAQALEQDPDKRIASAEALAQQVIESMPKGQRAHGRLLVSSFRGERGLKLAFLAAAVATILLTGTFLWAGSLAVNRLMRPTPPPTPEPRFFAPLPTPDYSAFGGEKPTE